MPKCFFYFLLLLCFANSIGESAFGQDMPNLKFNHLNVSNGLSSDLVKSIFQDHRGIMWICTGDAGFDRYDGNSIKNYRYNPTDSTSIPSNDLRYIIEDLQNKLWISTSGGLYFFDPITEKGKRIILNTEKNVEDILSIICDRNGFVFVNTNENIYEINSKTNEVIKYLYDKKIEEVFNKKKNYADLPHFYEDEKNKLWMGSLFVNREKKIIEKKGFDNAIFETQIIEDKNKKKWTISWTGGLKEWDENMKNFVSRYSPKDKIHSLITWQFKNEEYIFITVYPLGAALYNIKTKKYFELKHSSDETSITSSEDGNVFKDIDNRIWIASSKGVSILDPEMQHFKNRLLYEDVDKSTVECFGFARAFLESKDEFAISGSYQKGLFTYTKNWVFKKHYTSIPPNTSDVKSQEISYILQEKNGDTWYSTDNGLVKKSNGVYRRIIPDSTKKSIQNNGLYFRTILKRDDGKFWVRNSDKKLYLFDPVKEKFIKNYENEITASATAIALDAEENVWITTNNGLYWLDVKRDKVEKILFSTVNKFYEKALNNLRFLFFDKENILWITSEYGLIKFNTITKKYENIEHKDGLPENNLLKIVEDNNGYLWINTSKGIIQYDKKKLFNYYTAGNGLPFTFNDLRCTFIKLSSGNILLGYTGGVIEFNPKDFITIKKDITALILDVLVDNKFIPTTTESNKNITLEPTDRQIKIHFGIANYTAVAYNKFYFYIEEFKTDWQECTVGNIDFYKLPAGKYTLHVKGVVTNASGKIIEDILHITIKPFWYQTNWFKAFLALLLLMIVTSIIFFRSKQVRKKENLKNFYENKMLGLEMQTLRSQMNPHFLFNTLNSINSYIIQNKTSIASEYLTTFSKLMRNILELSKQEKVTIDKEINALKMYIELEALRLENKFDYSITIDNKIEQLNTYIPSLIIQPFVENAIWHGLHNKKDAGHIEIQVCQKNEQLIITIEDDGIGRVAAAALKKQTVTHKSFGIDITINRIKMLDKENSVNIIDLYSSNKIALGTKVIITINNKQND